MNLQDAKGIVEQFDDLQFTVDSTNPDMMLWLSGYEMKAAIGTPKHIQTIEEVTGLPGELEKKLDQTGGTMTGDLRVEALLLHSTEQYSATALYDPHPSRQQVGCASARLSLYGRPM